MIKKSRDLTLKDKLSRLTYLQACKLLGDNGQQILQQGGQLGIEIEMQVRFSEECFELRLLDEADRAVTITLSDDAQRRLQLACLPAAPDRLPYGAALSLILEEKVALGLAKPPSEDELPLEMLSEEALVRRAIAERAERAASEKMTLLSTDPAVPWTEYTVTSALSGKTYRLSLRGEELGRSYCSCPDFRTNHLGTCKHILCALNRIKKRFPVSLRKRPYRTRQILLRLHYGKTAALWLEFPANLNLAGNDAARALERRPIDDAQVMLRCISRLERSGHCVNVSPDAEEFIQQQLFQNRIKGLVAGIRRDPANHPLRKELLKVELLPYQLDGIAFALGAGRAILADDMGLGKTIQGVGLAELLAREADIGKVLVICPASLKSQWRSEIQRFSRRDCQLVLGGAAARAAQYGNRSFFTVCNYEQVLRDLQPIEKVKWDLILLDEGQRIKNWEAKTSSVIKSLKSPFALVLSGTPLENRLDELYSVVQFIDDRRLAPAYRFFHRHRVVDDRGKVLGYKNLGELRENLQPILLRRTRESVMQQLPARSNEIVRIPPTQEQVELHQAHMHTVSQILHKKYLTEMDLLRLQKALLMCRMAADSTYLVNKEEPGFSSKLERLDELFDQLLQEENRKIVLFSEWTTMLDLIEPMLQTRAAAFVRLDGSVPQTHRASLVHRFQTEPGCRFFLATNAGATGLNLQAANTLINIDLPWNPAVLEQRVGRIHRMGQKRPVQVYVLITEETLEEKLLSTLSAKHQLALAALDIDSEVQEVQLVSGMEELRRRLEVLLGAKPEAPVDESLRQQQVREAAQLARRERMAAAGGHLLGAAFQFLGELVGDFQKIEPPPQLALQLQNRLAECTQVEADGRHRLSITLPDRAALDNLSQSIARLLALGGAGPD